MGSLLLSPSTSTPNDPSKHTFMQLPVPIQVTLGRIDQLVPLMSYVGVSLVSFTHNYLTQKQPYEQNQQLVNVTV